MIIEPKPTKTLYFDNSNDGIWLQKTNPSKISPIVIKNIDSILDSFLFIIINFLDIYSRLVRSNWQAIQ